MNLGQLIEEINKDLDDSLDNSELIGWINRCVDDLTPIARYQKIAAITIVTNQKDYELPSDFMRLVQLVDSVNLLNEVPLSNYTRGGYKLWGNQLMIQPTPIADGIMDLYYEGKLPHLVEMTDEPQIPSQFHDLLILYTVAKARYQDEEEGLQMNAWSEYQSRKRDLMTFNRKVPFTPIRDVYGL